VSGFHVVITLCRDDMTSRRSVTTAILAFDKERDKERDRERDEEWL
jgi:hypothetical protein